MIKKILVLAVVFSLLACSINLMAKERRGAELVITKIDGQQIAGELIAVKPSSLLLLDSQSDVDESVEIEKIATIRIIKKSKAWKFGSSGFVTGGLLGLIFGGVVGANDELDTSFGVYIALTAIFGILVAIPSALIGAYLGKDENIQLEERSDTEIKEILEKLRRQARVPDAQ